MNYLLYSIPKEATPLLTFIELIAVVTVIVLSRAACRFPFKIPRNKELVSWFLLLFCMVFAFYGGDFYHWVDDINEMRGTANTLKYMQGELMQIEWPYYYIGYFVNYDFILSRIVIWGTAFILFSITAKRLEVNFQTFIYCFAVFALSKASYGRVALAWAIGYYGYSFIVKPPQNTFSKYGSIIIGCIVIAISTIFHKSALLLPLTMGLSLISFKKWTIILLAIGFPIAVLFANSDLLPFLQLATQEESDLVNVNTTQYYLEGGADNIVGIGMQVNNFIEFTTYYLVLVLVVLAIWKGDYKSWPFHIQKYANIVILTISIASVFLFTKGFNTYVIFYRFLFFSVFPIAILMTYVVNREKKKFVRLTYIFATISTLYMMLYSFYNTL